MELRVLRYFLTVVREESITRAADALNITQPTLSRQIMELEEELNTQLIIRGSRKLSLTDDGMLLRKRAEEIIDLVDKAENEIKSTDEVVDGEIYIGAGETDAMRIIAKAAKDLKYAYPGIRYNLFSGNGDDVSEKLDKGLLDFGILIEPADTKKYDYIKLPAVDTWGLLMKKDSPLASKEHIIPSDLLNVPILCSRQSLVKNVLSGWLGQDFDKLNIIATYNLIFNASIMVDQGFGCALTLDKLVNTTGDSNLCFKPLFPKLEAGLVIVWKKYQVFSKAAEIFLNNLQKHIS